ncbi:MAG: diguanylate cyclase [Sulfurimonas sp.]|nr:diguanylate cyclase [Sulfurimonas sp.]PHQ92554.1 MAG: hypothetical protein COB42_01255 [Sulfurimonas sp.]
MSTKNDTLDTLSNKELTHKIKTSLAKKTSLEYLLDNLLVISWEYDLAQAKFTAVSSGTNKVLEYTVEEWTHTNTSSVMIHEEDRKRVTEYCTKETGDGKDHLIEYRIVEKSGKIIWILDFVTLSRDEAGKPLKLFGFILNINEKKQEQLRLEKEHQFLETVINGISDHVMIIDADYNVSLMNDKVKRRLEGRIFLDQEHPKCYEIAHYRNTPCEGADSPCPLKDVLENAKATKVIHHQRCADGSDKFMEIAASPLLNKDNACIGIIESERDITQYMKLTHELKEKTKLLHYQAHHDYLTGLPNRALFMDRLEEALKDTKRHKVSLALFFMDLDHFKVINDTYGHEMGDNVLKEVSKLFKENTRENDVISRLGGDEFTLILKDIKHKDEVECIANKFINIFEEPLTIDGKDLHLSISIGISMYSGEESTADVLLHDADTAMYKVKGNGKNSFQFSS